MNKFTLYIGISPILVCALITDLHSQNYSELGRIVAQESAALVFFVAMGNFGANDAECKGVGFPTTDIYLLVDSEIAPTLDMLHTSSDAKGIVPNRAEILKIMREIPERREGGSHVVRKQYEEEKIKARNAYGAASVCSSVSTMIQTVIQQKRLSLRNIKVSFGAKK